jgi:hydrogenase expression/formation protein HypC
MCIGIPMRVVEAEDCYAWCEGRAERQHLDMRLVGTQPPGAWVLAFQGSARRTMSTEEAAQTNAALDALEAVRLGHGNLDGFFADLVGQAPQLPQHLRKATAK